MISSAQDNNNVGENSTTIKSHHYDIIVVGGGPAGLSFAASMGGSSLRVLIIEKRSLSDIAEPVIDGRDIALTHLSKRLMSELGMWQILAANDISEIHQAKVLDGDSDYSLNFSALSHLNAGEKSEGALGFMVPNYRIQKVLYDKVASFNNIDLLAGSDVVSTLSNETVASVTLGDGQVITSDLLIAADSRFSAARRQLGIGADMEDFGRSVIVCRASHTKKNPKIAYECFKYGSTLAVLPINETTASLVITLPSDQAASVMQQSPDEFSDMVSQQFKYRLGKMNLLGERHCYPLVAVLANKFIAQRFALIGDAAVGMHPVTAHGFNLGLRGQNTLANLILSASKVSKKIDYTALLQKYNRKHQRHCRPMYYGTNLLVRLFTNDKAIPKFLRKAVLHASNNIPPLKRTITNQLTELRD